MGLKYIGGGRFCPPYPARDLTDAEVIEYGKEALLATGLYVEESAKAKPAGKPAPVKDGEA